MTISGEPRTSSQVPEPRSHMKPARLIIAGVVLGCVAAVVAVIALNGREEPAVSSTPQRPAAPASHEQDIRNSSAPAVQVTKPQRRDIVKTLTLPANISPWYQATLYGKVSGYLKWIGADKGDVVKKGQLLAVIDAPEIDDQFKQAEADYEIKRITFERYLSVWQENHDIIAKQDVDVARSAAQSAKHLRDSRRTLLEYTKLYAPFAGVITARFADPGALIQAATGSATQAVPLFTVMDMSTVRIYVNVPQEAALLSKPGTPAVLTIRELPQDRFEATVTRTTEALDPATRTLLVEIDLDNTARKLQPGMFANVTLQLERHLDTLAVPPAAVITTKGGQEKSLYVVEQGTAKLTRIQTGLDDGLWVEVTGGLTGTEDVVVVGKGGLKDGQEVLSSPYNLPSGKPARQKL